MSLSCEELERFVAELAADPERWRHLVRHDRELRCYEQIWDDGDVNAWLICWSEDHDTGFHDHDESAAAIAVIEGEIREERLRLADKPAARTSTAGETFSIEASAIHRVLHAGDGPAVTIHAYSPPLQRTGVYRVGAGGTLERIAQHYDHELRAEPALS